MKQFIAREAAGVFVWSLVSCVLRAFLSSLVALSKLQSGDDAISSQGHSNCLDNDGGQCWIDAFLAESWAFQELITVASVASSWVLLILPSKVSTLSAPGFTFASTWVLYPLREYFGFIPNLPCRICETKMGRLSLRELAIVLPIHFLVPIAAFWIQTLLPVGTFTHAIEPVVYSEQHNWAVDFVRETLVNAAFTVSLLVVPELLKINGIRRGYALLVLYPLYSFGVDADGMASVFGPNLIYSLRCVSAHEEVPIAQWSHLLGPILGGVIGGSVMKRAFPDDK